MPQHDVLPDSATTPSPVRVQGLPAELLRAIFEHAPFGIAVNPTSSRAITNANERYAEIVGRPLHEVIGLDWTAVTHPDDVEEDLAQTELVTDRQLGRSRMPKRYVRPDGTTVWVEMSLVPMDLGDGTEPTLLCMVDDITERHTAEVRLRQLAEILEASPDYVATTDAHGRILWANAACLALFGVSEAEDFLTEHHNLFSFFSPASRDEFLTSALPDLWASGAWVGEVEGRFPDGTLLPLSFAAIAHYGPDGYPEYFSGIARDITGMKLAEEALSKSETRMRTLVDAAPIGIFETSAMGSCTYVNPAFCQITGIADPQDALGFGWGKVVHPQDAVKVGTAWATAVHLDQPMNEQFRFVAADGRVVWTDVEAVPVRDPSGRTYMFLGTIDDVTERLELERARFESAELFRTAFENAPTGMVLTDVEGVKPVLVQCNSQYASIVGRTVEELVGLQMTVISHPDDLPDALEGRRALIAGEIDRHHMEIRTQRPDESWIWCSLTRSLVRDADGNPKYSLSQVSDITEAKLAQERIEHFAFSDPLTGLANRRAFLERLDRAVESCTAAGTSVALAFIDLDHFKTVNDQLGHDAGDELLIAVAQGLSATVRSTDLVARLGGDEFALIITNIEPEQMRALAERIGAAMHFPRQLPDGDTVTVTASIGLVWAHGDDTVDEFLRRADAAMYRAKHLGRDQIVFDVAD